MLTDIADVEFELAVEDLLAELVGDLQLEFWVFHSYRILIINENYLHKLSKLRVVRLNVFNLGKAFQEGVLGQPILFILVDIRILLQHVVSTVDDLFQRLHKLLAIVQQGHALAVVIKVMPVKYDWTWL